MDSSLPRRSPSPSASHVLSKAVDLLKGSDDEHVLAGLVIISKAPKGSEGIDGPSVYAALGDRGVAFVGRLLQTEYADLAIDIYHHLLEGDDPSPSENGGGTLDVARGMFGKGGAGGGPSAAFNHLVRVLANSEDLGHRCRRVLLLLARRSTILNDEVSYGFCSLLPPPPTLTPDPQN